MTAFLRRDLAGSRVIFAAVRAAGDCGMQRAVFGRPGAWLADYAGQATAYERSDLSWCWWWFLVAEWRQG
jgi:hypothetical protein